MLMFFDGESWEMGVLMIGGLGWRALTLWGIAASAQLSSSNSPLFTVFDEERE